MNQSPYFSHDADARHDPRIKALIKKFSMEGYGIYWVILEMMRTEDQYKLSMEEYIIESIADETKKDYSFVVEFIEYCCNVLKLFKSDGSRIWSESFLDRMRHKDEVLALRRKAGLISAASRKREQAGKTEPPEQAFEITPVEHVPNITSTIKESNISKESKLNKERKIVKKETLKEQKLRLVLTRKELFRATVSEHTEYPDDMLRRFFEYWSELNKSGSQMRWEMEKTYELPKRLAYWASRESVETTKKKYHATDF